MALPNFSRRILPLIAVFAIICAGVWIAFAQPDRSVQEADRAPPQAPESAKGDAIVAASGVIEPSSEIIDVGTNVSGIVTDVHVAIGQRVTKGTPLFTVDTRQIRSALREAEAAIAEAQARLAEADTLATTARRQVALYNQIEDKGAISQTELIAAQGALANALAREKAARASLTAAEARRASTAVELARHTVVASIDGELLDVEVRVGELVSAGGPAGSNSTPYMQIGQTKPLHVRIDIDEAEVARLRAGLPAIISPRGAPQTKIPVRFVRIDPQIVPKRSLTNSASERVDVRVMQMIYAIPESETRVRVGQQVDAFIEVGR